MSIDWLGRIWVLASPLGFGLIMGLIVGGSAGLVVIDIVTERTKLRSYNSTIPYNSLVNHFRQSSLTSDPEVVLGEGEVIRAYRQCSIGTGGRITSDYDGGVWKYKEGLGYERDFTCKAGHTTVDPSCSCGIYALRVPQEGWFEVLLWGRVLEGSSGYRAEHARLVAVMGHRRQEWVKRTFQLTPEPFTEVVPKGSPLYKGLLSNFALEVLSEEPAECPYSSVPNLPMIPYEEWSKNIPPHPDLGGVGGFRGTATTSTAMNFVGGFGGFKSIK